MLIEISPIFRNIAKRSHMGAHRRRSHMGALTSDFSAIAYPGVLLHHRFRSDYLSWSN
ncbi:MAG: hypothetical protein AAF208_08540 [Cyanobacteria bacterium P01_A01_bin.45]